MNEIRQRNPLRPPICFLVKTTLMWTKGFYLTCPYQMKLASKVKRYQRIREMFKNDLDAQIGVKERATAQRIFPWQG